MLKQTPSNEFKSIKGIDQRLAQASVVCERTDRKFGARDCQVEWCTILRSECDIDRGWQARNLGACDSVCTRFVWVGFDVRRDKGVDSLSEHS